MIFFAVGDNSAVAWADSHNMDANITIDTRVTMSLSLFDKIVLICYLGFDGMLISQVRDHMIAKDSWGRTAVAHAVLSRRPQVFDAVLHALREEIRDDEVRSKATIVSKHVCGGG